MYIVEDSPTVARAQVSKEVLKEFFGTDDVGLRQLLKELDRDGFLACYTHRVRITRQRGTGWYMLSGYREDGNDLRLAVYALIQASNKVEDRSGMGL